MAILKFRKKGGSIELEKLRMEDITDDKRTALLNRAAFLNRKYFIDHGVYIAKNDIFFDMARLLNTTRKIIDAMLIKVDESTNIVIVPCKSYVFWNGKSVHPEIYKILETPENTKLQRQIATGAI